MKTVSQIRKDLDSLESVFGFNPNKVEQGGDEWMHMKLGIISASNAHKLLAKKGTATRDGYMAELVAQVATREMPEINAKALEWGKTNELAARAAYEFETGLKLESLPFIFGDSSLRFGCSPDGYSDIKGLELKCPFSSRTFIEFACSGKIKKEYEHQCQFSMYVTGASEWDFSNYDPRMTTKQFHRFTIERDEKAMKTFDDALREFIKDMDKMLEQISVEFGHQWHVKFNQAA